MKHLEKVEEIRRALSLHVKDQAYSKVKFIEFTNPEGSPQEDDYVVAYEAAFEPHDLEHAYLKISVTEDGQVGTGFETRARLAERLGAKLRTSKQAFAAGRELASIAPSELIAFVHLVAQGKVMLDLSLGALGLGKAKAIVSREDFAGLGAKNARHWDWLVVTDKQQSDTSRRKIMRFKPW